MTAVSQNRLFWILSVAVALTTAAEVFYLVVWGMWLFPAGNWAAKTVWTLTCGIAMGSVIGVATILWAEPLRGHRAALWRAVAVVIVVGSYCGWLCSTIDARLEYFGGAENAVLFIAASVIPAIIGGGLFGWLVYGGGPLAKQRASG